MPPVMILTDSSAYLPSEFVERYPIQVVPLTLNWDGRTYRDGVDIQATEFYQRLSTSTTLPTTSQISTGVLISKLQELQAQGYDVLMLLISSGISSTYENAESVVRQFPADHVALLDTKLVSMALGFQVLAAARAAADGAALADCLEIARRAYDHIGVYFTVDTLKYLAAGGRINTASRLLGTALNIKPILQIRGGKIELVSSVVSHKKALDRMLAQVETDIDHRTPVRISVFHALDPQAAAELMETARQRFAPVETIMSEVSPVIGTHVGPGTLALAYQAGD